MNIFKEASRLQLRFSTTKGLLSVEQLWSLSQKDLSTCIRNLKKVLKDTDDDELAFLDEKVSSVNSDDQLRFAILKEIFLTNKEESEANRTAKENKEFNKKIMDLIAEKEDGELKGKSIEELRAMIKS
jgi:hypothetical protein